MNPTILWDTDWSAVRVRPGEPSSLPYSHYYSDLSSSVFGVDPLVASVLPA